MISTSSLKKAQVFGRHHQGARISADTTSTSNHALQVYDTNRGEGRGSAHVQDAATNSGNGGNDDGFTGNTRRAIAPRKHQRVPKQLYT